MPNNSCSLPIARGKESPIGTPSGCQQLNARAVALGAVQICLDVARGSVPDADTAFGKATGRVPVIGA